MELIIIRYLFYTFALTSVFGYISGFCPTGCKCNTETNSKTHLLCDYLTLKIFRVSSKSYKNIDSIDLSGNHLESLNGRKVSRFAPNIRILYLKRNNFKKIYKETFEGFLHLNHLDLSNNEITDIDSYSFSYLIKLKSLYLRSNKLQTVNNIWFQNLGNLELIDLKNNLIVSFVPVYFQWPKNLKTLLLQSNMFDFLPPLPRNPVLVDLSDNKIDCSCQRFGQEKVNKDVLLNVTVICNKMSTESWRKLHWDNPFCIFPTVQIEYKKLTNGMYLVTCTGDGFPSPSFSLKHDGQAIATSGVKTQIIYGLMNDTNVTCEANSKMGKTESHLVETDQKDENDTCLIVKCSCNNGSDNDLGNMRNSTFSLLSVIYCTTMFVSCAFTMGALIVSLCIFNFSFKQFDNNYEL